MTTYNKLEQALSSAKGLQSDLKTFSLDTDDQQAQQMFSQLATNLENSVQALQSRLDFVGGEEPQYVQQSMGMQQQSGSQSGSSGSDSSGSFSSGLGGFGSSSSNLSNSKSNKKNNFK